MAGGNPFMPPGSSLPTGMPGANPAGPVSGGGPLAGALGQGGFGQGADPDAPVSGTGTGQPNNGQAPPGGQPPSLEQAGKMMDAQHKEGMKNQRMLDHLRTELDGLIEFGDMIRPEQVIEAAGRLVGHGISATDLAQIMSDMPAVGGEGLAGWLRMHEMAVSQMERGLAQQNSLIQHRMSMIGMRMLIQNHIVDRVGQHVQAAQQVVGQQAMASQGSMEPNALGGGSEGATDA